MGGAFGVVHRTRNLTRQPVPLCHSREDQARPAMVGYWLVPLCP